MRHDGAPRKAARDGERGRDPGVIIDERGRRVVIHAVIRTVMAIRRLRLTGKAKSFPLAR